MKGNQLCSRIEAGFATSRGRMRRDTVQRQILASSGNPTALCSAWTTQTPPFGLGLLSFQVHGLHRQVPVGREDLETLLLFALVGFLVGE